MYPAHEVVRLRRNIVKDTSTLPFRSVHVSHQLGKGAAFAGFSRRNTVSSAVLLLASRIIHLSEPDSGRLSTRRPNTAPATGQYWRPSGFLSAINLDGGDWWNESLCHSCRTALVSGFVRAGCRDAVSKPMVRMKIMPIGQREIRARRSQSRAAHQRVSVTIELISPSKQSSIDLS